jgi:AraC-like DNA-binding protein
MLTVGEGRILFWQGASLWVLGAGPDVGEAGTQGTVHAHHAVQVTLALDGWFELDSAGHLVSAAAAAIAADTPHAIRARGLVAFIFVEPESRAGHAIARTLFNEHALTAVPTELFGDLPQRLAAAFRDRTATETALAAIGRQIIERLAGDADVTTPDSRISKVIEWASSHLDGQLRLADAAAIVDLSPDRLRHLFVQQTGLTFRGYLLWLRLLKAVEAYSNGESLTEAAHLAGFSDSAHFSRTFRRMFGHPAAALRVT